MTSNINDSAMVASLAAIFGVVDREAESALAADKRIADNVAHYKTRKSDVEAIIRDDSRELSGFNAPRWRALANIGVAFGAAFNDPTRDHALAVAERFAAAYTKAGDKTMSGGGVLSGYAHLIMTRKDAERVRSALADRVAYWQGVHDNAPDGEKPADAKTRKARAKRFIENNSNANRWNGRPGDIIATSRGTITVPPRGAGPVASRLAEFAQMHAIYGEALFNDAVLDAFLDNGGRCEKAPDGPEEIAAKAADLLDQLRDMAGDSPDVVTFTLIRGTLARIRDGQGFLPPLPATVAPASQDDGESEPAASEGVQGGQGTPPAASEGGQDGAGEADADKVLADLLAGAKPPAKPRRGGSLNA